MFPLAIPLIAGPGAITTVLLKSSTGSSVMLGMLTIVLALTLAALLLAPRILKVLGETGTNVVGRVFGIVLAALAVQFMVDGIQSAFFMPRP